MVRNYIKATLRYISRNKGFTIINISGLAIGMMACLLITQYVTNELSYDDFHVNKDRIFRVQQDRYDRGQLSTRWAAGAVGVGPVLKTNFPEVDKFVRMSQNGGVLSYGDVAFREEYLSFASEDFFQVFSFPLMQGIDSLVLKEPFSVVLSQSTAEKYFGDGDPVGKTMRRNRTDYTVTGVYRDMPSNTHMKADALFSFSTLPKLYRDEMLTWNWDGYFTYLLLSPNSSVDEFKSKLPGFVEKHVEQSNKQYGAALVLNLQRLTDIHLDSDFMGEFKANGNRQSTYFLAIVAALILIIAWINYINLATAKSIERAREVGVRKVMGSVRTQLIQQFIVESLMLNILAVLIAIALCGALLPSFSELIERDFHMLLFRQVEFWIWLSLLIVAGALFSGLYPAFVLSAYRPVEVLKGRFKNSGDGVGFRKGMVITQFAASLTLIIGTFTVYLQLNYMKSHELGFALDQTLIVPSPDMEDSIYVQKFSVFKQRLKQYPEVSAITASSAVPGRKAEWNAGGIRRLSQREDEANQFRVIMMDEDFIPAYGLDVVAGRAFSDEFPNEFKNVMLNEAAAEVLGYEGTDIAINDQIFFWGDTMNVVGVVKNFHHESLKKAFDPLILRYNDAPQGMYSIKFNVSNMRETLANFEKEWKAIYPGSPFDYFFLDEYFAQQYQSDEQFGNIFAIFALLAIFIACLGLFGLSSLTVLQRTKEIGVRKVLGATIPNILSLMSREYLILLFVAILVAVPASWFIMSSWLADFAYQIDLYWWIFAVPCLVVILIAISTVSILTLKAALINPAKSLRYE